MRSGDHPSIVANACRALWNSLRAPVISMLQPIGGRTGGPTSLDALGMAYACWNSAGRLHSISAHFRVELDLTREQARIGMDYAEMIALLARRCRLEVVEESGHTRRIELQTPDSRWLVMDERALETGDVVTILTDITAQKTSTAVRSLLREEERQWARRYREEKVRAQAANRAKTAFLAHLSHEIRTPLNHIIGFADLIRHQTYGPLGDARYLGYIEDIMNSGENLLDMFSEILELAELEGGERILRSDEIRATDLVDKVAGRYAAQAQRAGLTFDLAMHAEALLNADATALKRMIGNLLDNAIRFTPKGGRVILALWPGEDGVVVEVSDTGVGISEDRLKTLTDPFVVADAALAREREGTGLGLAIAREIAQLSGGELAIESSLACGTTVAVSLPARVVQPFVDDAVAA